MDRTIYSQLRKGGMAFVGKNKNQPVIVFQFGRWHMLSIGCVVNSKMKVKRGIANVHFMSVYRARKTIKEWFPYSELKPYEMVCPAFREELAAKVLPVAEDYRPLLRQGWVRLAGGFTTDTLHSIPNEARDEDSLVAAIGRWMEEGQMGPFLHFERSCDAFG